MILNRAYKAELNPNNNQRTLLLRHAGAARWAWNWGLAKRIEEYGRSGKSLSAIDQHRQLNAIKATEVPWMYEVSKCAPQEALIDLERAFQSFFRRCENGEKPGFPKFKNRKRSVGGFRVTGALKVQRDRVWIPRIGWIRLKEHGYLPIDVKPGSFAISNRAGRWFVSVRVEEEIAVPENQGPAIGIDLGLTSLVTFSDGRKISPPKPLAKSLKKLRRLDRRKSRKCPGSANREKVSAMLAKSHYRVACQRADFLHKITSCIVREYSAVGVESLNVKGMIKNRCLSRAIGDAGWSQLLRQLRYKAMRHGSSVVEAHQFYPSTKTCSGCGQVKKEMPLATRVYRCEHCGLMLDRDVNAARNLFIIATAGSAERKALGDGSLELSLNRESSAASLVDAVKS